MIAQYIQEVAKGKIGPKVEKLMTVDEYIDACDKGEDPWIGGGDAENKVK